MKVPFYWLESVQNGSPFASLHHEWSPSSGAQTLSGCHCAGETCHPKKVCKIRFRDGLPRREERATRRNGADRPLMPTR